MKVTAKLPAPHSEIQKLVYKHLAPNDGSRPRGLWLACGTKYGKTISGACAASYALPLYPGQQGRWLAPIYKQTKYGWNYMKKMLPPKPYTNFRIGEMILNLPSKKCDLQFWHGQNPEDLEGEAVAFQVNDEAAKLKEQVWISSLTTWTRTRAQYINKSTPRGKNWFYRGCMRAKREEAVALKEGRVPKEIFRTAPTWDNPYIPRASIAEAKELLPQRLFDQYWGAQFVDDDSVFPPPVINQSLTKGEEIIPRGEIIDWMVEDHENRTVVAGADWAKKRDYTVLTCFDYSKRPFQVVGILRLNQVRYTEQVIAVAKFLRKFKACEILYHDKTGVGEALDDLLDAVPNLIYKGIVFSNASKSAMVNNYITSMENEDIEHPNCPVMIDELKEYEVTTNELGNMRYSAPEGDGNHDDCVCSLILGNAAASDYADSDFEVKFLEDLDVSKFERNTFENYVYESLDIDPDEGF